MEGESLQNFESILVQINPREIVLPQSEHPLVKKIQAIVERNRILVTHAPNAEFAALTDSDVGRLFNPKSKVGSLSQHPLSSSACRAVLHYLGLLGDSQDGAKFRSHQV